MDVLHHDLASLLGDRYTRSEGVRAQYARGESFAQAYLPDAVAFPITTEEVREIVLACRSHRVPIVASGAATSLEGHIAAVRGGVALNLSRMNQIIEINEEDLDCRVEAGVTREELNSYLRDRGLFFPIDPGANATIGGMAATRASGTNAVRYGTMAANVIGLTIVQPDGEVIRIGNRARKSAAGYDLTRLYIGSEGTLGIITEVSLRLFGIPEAVASATSAFTDLRDAVAAVTVLIQLGVPLARIEFLDEQQIRASNSYSHLNLPEMPHLFLEFHGADAEVEAQVERVGAIVREHGGSDFAWATAGEARNALWRARHNAYFAATQLRPGAQVWSSDVCVPISHLVEAVVSVREDIDRNNLLAPIIGHVGDGNFHVLFCLDPNDQDERSRAEAVYDRMIEHAIACGGTCTGEHGIGLMKRHHMLKEHGAATVETMRTIKRALDPLDLMNPGKMLP
jgi:D-lactate dehydrogenase (cytochrome)